MSDRAFAMGDLREVRATFRNAGEMDEAIRQLTLAGFDRADLTVSEPAAPDEPPSLESGARAPDTESDARQARTLHTSTAAAAAAMLATGITVATGGAALPAIAAAAAAAGAVGGATFAASSAANESEQQHRDDQASRGELILTVRAPTADRLTRAEQILRGAGAASCDAT